MKIGIAQTNPLKGNISRNIENHLALTGLALENKTGVILFPELSITGYEPAMAQEMAMDSADLRLEAFQQVCDHHRITIGLGVPIRGIHGIYISLVFFQAHRPRQVYSKQYLHPDEEAYFIAGERPLYLTAGKQKISPAICYELSVPDHADQAIIHGATIYMASVAKTSQGVEKAGQRLSQIARQYSIPVMMSNCIGFCDHFLAAGHSAVWNKEGKLLGQLNDSGEGVLVYDTDTGAVLEKSVR